MGIIILDLPQIPPAKSARKGKKGFYDPLDDVKKDLRWMVKAQYDPTPLKGPICLFVAFCMKIPDSVSKKKRKEMLAFSGHVKRPDLDNLLKTLNDILKGIVFEDDSQIFDLHAVKHWCEEPGTTVKIWPVPTDWKISEELQPS